MRATAGWVGLWLWAVAQWGVQQTAQRLARL